MQGKKIVIAIALFSVIAATAITLMMTKSERFDTTKQTQNKVIDPKNIVKITVAVEGMTCTACEPTIHMMVKKLSGIASVKASYVDKNTVVEFDKTQTTASDIIQAIKETGYKVTAYEDTSGKHELSTQRLTPKKQDNAMKCGAGKCGSSMKCGSSN